MHFRASEVAGFPLRPIQRLPRYSGTGLLHSRICTPLAGQDKGDQPPHPPAIGGGGGDGGDGAGVGGAVVRGVVNSRMGKNHRICNCRLCLLFRNIWYCCIRFEPSVYKKIWDSLPEFLFVYQLDLNRRVLNSILRNPNHLFSFVQILCILWSGGKCRPFFECALS